MVAVAEAAQEPQGVQVIVLPRVTVVMGLHRLLLDQVLHMPVAAEVRRTPLQEVRVVPGAVEDL